MVELPRPGLHEELCASLAAHGLRAEVVGERIEDDGTAIELRVGFADEPARLLADPAQAIAAGRAARALPLVGARAHGGCLLRPPGD